MKTFEIQIPVSPNTDSSWTDEFIAKLDLGATTKFSEATHQKFLFCVGTRSGGYSVLPEISGFWTDEKTGKSYAEKMIPVRIACTEADIAEIAQFAKEVYEQEAIFVLEIGEAKFY